MIHPSYSELIEAINTNNEDDDEALVLNSRYSLVLAASKRARQLIAGAEPLVPGAAGKTGPRIDTAGNSLLVPTTRTRSLLAYWPGWDSIFFTVSA